MDHSDMINKLLSAHGVEAEVVGRIPAPSTTRYELQTQRSVTMRAINNLSETLPMALGVSNVVIGPLLHKPGRVGIDVPNEQRRLVSLSEITGLESLLALPLGIDADNTPRTIDLASVSTPHMLVAGSTGSGKSTWLNAALITLITHNTPAGLRLVMIDLKRVELSQYRGVPHLWTEIAVDIDTAGDALYTLVSEQRRRYELMEAAGCTNLDAYNLAVQSGQRRGDVLPRLVLVVDELADLMARARKTVEPLLVEITALGRAAGVHAILATQRPSVDVVPGLIKDNLPARLAFRVPTHHGSMIILDETGAHKLRGGGDGMVKAPDIDGTLRIQGVYVSESDVRREVMAASVRYRHTRDSVLTGFVDDMRAILPARPSPIVPAPEPPDSLTEWTAKPQPSVVGRSLVLLGSLIAVLTVLGFLITR